MAKETPEHEQLIVSIESSLAFTWRLQWLCDRLEVLCPKAQPATTEKCVDIILVWPIFVHFFPGEMGKINFTRNLPHIRRAGCETVFFGANSFTARLWELGEELSGNPNP